MTLPWQPLYTVLRSGQPEVTQYGIVAVVDGSTSLLETGDCTFPVWTRSLLKPFQFLTHYPILKENYSWLNTLEYALMMSSHNGEAQHVRELDRILETAGLKESDLQCPACYPMSNPHSCELKALGSTPKPFYHPCCGKHLAALLSLKARKLPLDNYLDPAHEDYQKLKKLLAQLLNRSADFPETVDGCGMPNYPLTAPEIASLFRLITQPTDIEHWSFLQECMLKEPFWIGGTGRLDSRLIEGGYIAKEGADGLLAVGIPSQKDHPDGMGILIKLAGGYDSAVLETTIREIFRQLNLKDFPSHTPELPTTNRIEFSFSIPSPLAGEGGPKDRVGGKAC